MLPFTHLVIEKVGMVQAADVGLKRIRFQAACGVAGQHGASGEKD
jgi:hypothetical protein